MRSDIVVPTYTTWKDVPCTASLNAGDILPDGSTVLWKTRTSTATEWTNYDISVDSPSFPTTSKDMSLMHMFKSGQILKGTDAQKNLWYRSYKRDIEGVTDSNYNSQKVYKSTFK